ncbi:hypothetical protein TNCV_174751 [Trichonephila clavipes]|nr:hypothetical protein TNCV_174751 [Trichonephila clavipes]
MEQSAVPESPLKDLLPESPLKDPMDSKPPIVSKSPDPPVKNAHVKKILRDPERDEMRKNVTRNEGMRNEGHETSGCIEDPISDPRIKGMISNPECFEDPLMHRN